MTKTTTVLDPRDPMLTPEVAARVQALAPLLRELYEAADGPGGFDRWLAECVPSRSQFIANDPMAAPRPPDLAVPHALRATLRQLEARAKAEAEADDDDLPPAALLLIA